MKGHHTPNICQGKISLKTRQIGWITLPDRTRYAIGPWSPGRVRSLSVRRYDW
jgi:hypothetical protein